MTDVATDACCLINLLSAGTLLPQTRARAKGALGVSAAFGAKLHVPKAVAQESLFLLEPDKDDQSKLVKAPLDLAPYFEHGVLDRCDVEGDDELRCLVQYAARLDDGEAACLAIAKCRGWVLATDDRLASKVARQDGVVVITTPELVKRWADSRAAKKSEISQVVANIRRFARFVPRPDSPEAEWWISHLN